MSAEQLPKYSVGDHVKYKFDVDARLLGVRHPEMPTGCPIYRIVAIHKSNIQCANINYIYHLVDIDNPNENSVRSWAEEAELQYHEK